MPKPPEPAEPPVHAAARTGDLAELARLIAGGVDIDTRRDLEEDNGPHLRSLTPLMVAARSIDGATVETLKWLIEHGADLHAQSEGGETAAFYAAGKGGRWEFHPWRHMPDHAERLRFLLDAGLDPNETSFVGRSLLIEACTAGDPSRVRLLLERGATLTGGLNAERRAAGSVVDFLRDHAPEGMSQEQFEAMAAYLPKGNPEGRVSYTIPLFCAAMSGSAECVRMLLEAGADLHERDGDDKVALMYAGSPEVVDALIDAGIAPNVTSEAGDAISVLLSGAGCMEGLCGPGRFEVVRALLARGATLDRPGKGYCQIRLHEAAFRQDAESVLFLLSLGANASETDDGGRTALHAICWQGEYANPETNVSCERIIRALVAAGADVNAADAHGSVPLHEAAGGDWGNQTAVRTLLELGAKPDPEAGLSVTPLMIAAGHGDGATVKLLLAAGADAMRQDGDGLTAGWHAMRHLNLWQSIVQMPIEPDQFATVEEKRARQLEVLRKAEECDAMFNYPPRPGRPF